MSSLEMYVKTVPQGISGTEYRGSKAYIQPAITYGQVISQAAWNDTKVGFRNPDWRKQVARHVNATTSYTVSGYKRFKLKSDVFAVKTDSFGRIALHHIHGLPPEWGWGNLPDPAVLYAPVADNLARQRFIAKYRDKRTAFQGGIFLGEMREVVEMIKRPAKALRNGIDLYYGAVKERLRRSKRQRKRIIQDTWLEYQFGWKPLIRDAEDACRLACASPMGVYEELKAGHREELVKADVLSNFTRPDEIRVWFNTRTYGFYQVSYKGVVGAENEPPGFPEQLGLSWSNVLPTVWELIPYSFLFDYFTNIGKVIEGASTGKIRMTWGSKSQIREYGELIAAASLDRTYLNAAKPSGGTISGDATFATGPIQSRTQYTRSPFNSISFGIGDFRFKLPGTGTKWLNIAALNKMRR